MTRRVEKWEPEGSILGVRRFANLGRNVQGCRAVKNSVQTCQLKLVEETSEGNPRKFAVMEDSERGKVWRDKKDKVME